MKPFDYLYGELDVLSETIEADVELIALLNEEKPFQAHEKKLIHISYHFYKSELNSSFYYFADSQIVEDCKTDKSLKQITVTRISISQGILDKIIHNDCHVYTDMVQRYLQGNITSKRYNNSPRE